MASRSSFLMVTLLYGTKWFMSFFKKPVCFPESSLRFLIFIVESFFSTFFVPEKGISCPVGEI